MIAPSQTDAFARYVHELEAFGHRGSASPHEHAAADYLVAQMRAIGLTPLTEPFAGARSLPERLLAHVIVAAAGAVLLWKAPVATVVFAAAALISFLAEQTTRIVLLSRPVVRFVSLNVVATVPAARPPRRRIVLSAHYDTQHSGFVWTINRHLMLLGFRSPLPLKPPMLPVVYMMAAEVALGGVSIALPGSLVVTVLTGLLLGCYAVLAALFVQWALGRPVPGAADNASGVAAVLALAEGWHKSPAADDVELVVLLSGCEESGMLGAAAWADRHRRELRTLPATFLNIDAIGFGPPRFLGAEVPIAGLPLRTARQIVDACSEAAADLGLSDAGPHAVPGPTDGLAFLARQIPGVTITGFRSGGVMPHYHTLADTAANMDFAAARTAVAFAQAVLTRLAMMG